MKTSEIFLSNNSIAINLVRKYEYPYMLLPYIKDYIIELGKTLNSDYYLSGENIWIHKSAKIDENVTIIGPCIIDECASIRHCAYIRGSVIIGKNSVVGNSCEIKNSILFDNVTIPHFNYVGDSVIGYSAHMGAGAVTSNVKSDKKNVIIKTENNCFETNLKKVGAFIGDNVEIGCNTVLNPGSIVGPNTIIYPLISFRGVVGADKIVKDMKKIIEKI